MYVMNAIQHLNKRYFLHTCFSTGSTILEQNSGVPFRTLIRGSASVARIATRLRRVLSAEGAQVFAGAPGRAPGALWPEAIKL